MGPSIVTAQRSGQGPSHGSIRKVSAAFSIPKRRSLKQQKRQLAGPASAGATPVSQSCSSENGVKDVEKSATTSCRITRAWIALVILACFATVQQMHPFRTSNLLENTRQIGTAMPREQQQEEESVPSLRATPEKGAFLPSPGDAWEAGGDSVQLASLVSHQAHSSEMIDADVVRIVTRGHSTLTSQAGKDAAGSTSSDGGFRHQTHSNSGNGNPVVKADDHASSVELPSVILGIPTVPRPKGVNYLEQTLQAVLSQVEDEDATNPALCTISILVVNVYGPGHSAFEASKKKHKDNPRVDFLTIGEGVNAMGQRIVVSEGDPLLPRAAAKRKALPTTKVQKQTRDLVYLLRAAGGRAANYLFMEDDMLLCDGGAAAIGRMLGKANSYFSNWIAIRASFGMNGILIQDKDVMPFATYLETHQKRRPPDHLVVEWFGGETPDSLAYKADRKHFAFRYNIFHHLGSVSTLRGKPSPPYPACFEELTMGTLFEVEVFDFKGCPNEDLSPCDAPEATRAKFPKIGWPERYGVTAKKGVRPG